MGKVQGNGHMATVPKKFADADLIRRVGQVVHAAILYAGFVSYGVQPPSGHVVRQSTESGTSLTLCRWYTAPQLAHREDAEAAVLLLCAAEGSSDVALVIFLTEARDMKGTYLERLDAATLALSAGSQQGGRRCSKISLSLADRVCRGLLGQLRRRNGLTLPGFKSLPDDAKVEVLKRLRSGADLARVECACRDLRRLVAARDGELWRHMYWHEAPDVKGRWRSGEPGMFRYEDLYEDMISILEDDVPTVGCMSLDEFEVVLAREVERARKCQWGPFVPVDVKSSEDGVPSWKEKYLLQRNRLYAGSRVLLPKTIHAISWRLRQRPRPGDAEEAGKVSIVQHQKKAPRSAYDEKRRGRRGAGTTHSTSSRYRWSHR